MHISNVDFEYNNDGGTCPDIQVRHFKYWRLPLFFEFTQFISEAEAECGVSSTQLWGGEKIIFDMW